MFLGTAYTSTSEITVALREIYQQQRSQLINYLSNHPPNQRFYFRLLQLLPETEYFVIVNTLLDRFSIELKTAITEFIRFIIDSLNNSLDRYNQWQIISAILVECSSCSERQFRNNFTEIVTDITHQTRSDHDIFFSEIIDIFSVLFEAQLREDNFNIIQQKQRSQLIKYLSNQLQNQPFSFRLLQLIPEVELQLTDARSNSPDFYQVDDIEQQNQLEILSQAIAATDNQFPLTVNYAGLVLLYPFINPFFEATGVKETNSKIIIDSKIAHAAALLHFLATGEEELYEYELGLIKILLGLEPETPLLVSAGLLQEGNRTEAETVLQSTINYWSVLKNTSINGLRTSFLQRSGLLRRTENGWQLQVEPQSFDMLLE